MVSFLFPLVSALHWGCGWEPFVWVKASWRCNRCGGQDRRSQKSPRWNTVVQLGSHAFISQSGPPWVHIAGAACLFVSKPHVCLTRSHQHARAALARAGRPSWS